MVKFFYILVQVYFLGRLQVAAKYMPVSQLIIGIDLASIKPIPNVITMVNDITTEKCRTDLKRELKTWKADVFLNDGAPNVGSSWVHDAFTQAELVLSALKLATEFLVEGGTFVTKVFRSKDYNSLIWVFKQLFKNVEATKPASSRDVSAEIFVVCRGFLAPSHIDPKFLDPKYVFQEVGSKASGQSSGLNILQPEKKQRHRDGYEDEATILHKVIPVMEFINSKDPVAILSTANVLSFPKDDPESMKLLSPNDDIELYCEDLKVIGRKEFKALLKWRTGIRASRQKEADQEDNLEDAKNESETEEDPLKELDDLNLLVQKQLKREKRKELEKKAKQRLRLQLQMENTGDLADDMAEEGLFDIKGLKKKAKLLAVAQAEGEQELEEPEAAVEEENESESEEFEDSADEAAKWDDEMEEEYQRFKMGRLQKDALRYVKHKHGEKEQDLSDLEDETADIIQTDYSDSDSEDNDDSGLTVDLKTDQEKSQEMKKKAEMFFSNPLFSAVTATTSSKRKQRDNHSDDEEEDDHDKLKGLSKKSKKSQKKQKKQDQKDEDKETSKIEFVKADPQFTEDFDEDTKDMMSNPTALTLASKLVADKRRRKEEMIDESFNRFSFGDSKGLPCWFLEDESRHNKPQIPITKEAAAMIKEKLKKLEAQPSKKVLEAKGRNKMRAIKRLEALKKKAAVIADSEEIGGRQKSEQIEKIMRSGKKPTKKEKKVVVAKGKLRGVKGRPKGVKGHYKMVDGRSKKDQRAVKAKAKGNKKGRKAGGRK